MPALAAIRRLCACACVLACAGSIQIEHQSSRTTPRRSGLHQMPPQPPTAVYCTAEPCKCAIKDRLQRQKGCLAGSMPWGGGRRLELLGSREHAAVRRMRSPRAAAQLASAPARDALGFDRCCSRADSPPFSIAALCAAAPRIANKRATMAATRLFAALALAVCLSGEASVIAQGRGPQAAPACRSGAPRCATAAAAALRRALRSPNKPRNASPPPTHPQQLGRQLPTPTSWRRWRRCPTRILPARWWAR